MKLPPSFLHCLLCVPAFALAATPELVLQEHVRLNATTSDGVVAVVSGSGLARTYQWAGCSLEAHMGPRATRWFGSLGIYDPAPGVLGSSSNRQCQGVSRTVVSEGQIHFADAEAAVDWLRRYGQVGPTVWSSDGLIVQWFTSPRREQLNVSVWQVCIANRYPAQLFGANDPSIQLTRIAGAGQPRHPCASVAAEVVTETQAAWRKHWESVQEWKARTKPRN